MNRRSATAPGRRPRALSALFLAAVIALMPASASAAEPFPYDRFNEEKGNILLQDGYDTDYPSPSDETKAGYFKTREVEFFGYEDHEEVWKQVAHVGWKIPEGYAGFLKENDLDYGSTYSKENDAHQDTFYYKPGSYDYAWNSIFLELEQSVSDSYITKLRWKRTLEEEYEYLLQTAEDKCVSRWGADWKNENTDSVAPVTVTHGEDGSVFAVFHRHISSYERVSKVYEGAGEVPGYLESLEDEYLYLGIYTVPELPGMYCCVFFRQSAKTRAVIYDERNHDYQGLYSEYQAKHQALLSSGFAEAFCKDRGLIEIRWDEPLVSDSAAETTGEETTETAESETEEETVHVTVTHKAREEAGEDEGTSIPAIVIIGGGAALAAVGAGAAILLKKNSDKEKEKKKKTYKMYVRKDFGNALPRGGEPAAVGVRIAERDADGTEHDRDDLSAKISASSGGLAIHRVRMAGRYLEAFVSVPKEYAGETAGITFSFTGEGGSFARTVEFKVSQPALRFASETEPGSGSYRLGGGPDGI